MSPCEKATGGHREREVSETKQSEAGEGRRQKQAFNASHMMYSLGIVLPRSLVFHWLNTTFSPHWHGTALARALASCRSLASSFQLSLTTNLTTDWIDRQPHSCFPLINFTVDLLDRSSLHCPTYSLPSSALSYVLG